MTGCSLCGVLPAKLYPAGWRCPDCTPARCAGRPEPPIPDPALTLDGLRRAAGIIWRFRATDTALNDEFDGWAIACPPDAVAAGIYAPLPYGTRVMVWHRSNALPSRTRIGTRWEAVLVCPPLDRIPLQEGERQLHDVLSCAAPGSGFAGAKPRQWTRWVLDALGYDPDTDQVVDLFPGSGAVSAEVAQGVLL